MSAPTGKAAVPTNRDDDAGSMGHDGMTTVAPPSLFEKAFHGDGTYLVNDRLALQLHAAATMFPRSRAAGGGYRSSGLPDPATATLMRRPAPPLPPAVMRPEKKPASLQLRLNSAVSPLAGPPRPDVVHLGLSLRGLKRLAERVERLCQEGRGGPFKVGFESLTTTELVYRCEFNL